MPTINVGDNWQSAVNANAINTVFTIAAGTHQFQSVVPKTGMQFLGNPGAILTGGRTLTGWTQSGANWFVGGQTQGGTPSNSGGCAAGFPRCQYAEQLFVDGAVLIQSATLALLVPGMWFFDYIADRIYVANNPAGHTIITSVTPRAFSGTAASITVAGLIVEYYASTFGQAAIDCGNSWVVDSCETRYNGNSGIRVNPGCHVSSCHSHHNGEWGMSGGGTSTAQATGIIVDGVELNHNNTNGWQTGFGAGGTKFTQTTGMIFRNSNVHDNNGSGAWWDIDNHDTQVYGNTIDDNGYQGIFMEISWGGKIYNNTVRRNGFGRDNGAGFGAGILIAATPDVEIYNNTVQDNNNGICGLQQNRGSGDNGVHETNNMYVHDNIVRVGASQYSGFSQGVGDDTFFTSRGNRWVNNHYTILGGNLKPFTWMNARRTIAEWQAYGEDVTGTFGGTTLPTGPGQWSYDTATNILYVWPIGSVNPSSVPISAFDWRFGMEEIVMVRTNGVLLGRLCRHFSYASDPNGADVDSARGGSVSYDGSRVVFDSNWGGGAPGIYCALTNSAL